MHGLLEDIGVALIASTLLGLISHWLRQPIILGYLLAGAFIGPQVGLGLVQHPESTEIISEIGLVLLLFVIGLEIDLKELKRAGKQLLLGGLGQFPLCVGFGCLFFPLVGFSFATRSIDVLYLAIMCALSSTAIVVKILYDKREIGTLPGRVTLGVLVIQDVFAILVLALQPNLGDPSIAPIAKALGSTVLLVAFGFLSSRYLLSKLFTSIAKSPEMVLSVSLGWCALMAVLAGSMNLSKEMGALIAGICISAYPYSIHVIAKSLPLRDFFLTLFFVSLGMQISPPSAAMVMPVLLVGGFVICSRFVTLYPLLAASGAGRRTAFVASLNLSQISEFSLVIGALGLQFKHIGADTLAVMTYAMALLAILSSYSIRFNHEVYLGFERILRLFGLTADRKRETAVGATHPEIAILGCHSSALAFISLYTREFPEKRGAIHVIDFNPLVLRELERQGVPATFGDIASLDTLKHAHLDKAELIILSIPDMLLKGIDNEELVQVCRDLAPRAKIVATADDPIHAQQLQALGADALVMPFALAGERLMELAPQLLSSRTRE